MAPTVSCASARAKSARASCDALSHRPAPSATGWQVTTAISTMTARDDSPLPAITVRRALELPALRAGLPEVVAGAGQLDRPLRWVHAGEVANIAALLTGGEMLLTTGMGIGARAAEQRRFRRRSRRVGRPRW